MGSRAVGFRVSGGWQEGGREGGAGGGRGGVPEERGGRKVFVEDCEGLVTWLVHLQKKCTLVIFDL